MKHIFPPNGKIRRKTLSHVQVCKRLNLTDTPSSKVRITDYAKNTITIIEPVIIYYPTTVRIKVREDDLSLTPVDAYGSETRYFVEIQKHVRKIPMPKRPKNVKRMTTVTYGG